MIKTAKDPVLVPPKGGKMIKATYIAAGVLLAGWAAGFLVFHADYRIHVLLILAMLAVLVNIIREG
jgi:hypothetical protein